MDENQDPREYDFLEGAYRPPLWMTLVFCVTMLAIYFMGRTVTGFYESPTTPAMVQSIL